MKIFYLILYYYYGSHKKCRWNIWKSIWRNGEYYYGVAWVKKDGKYGYINKAKEEITPIKYDKAKDFKGGFGFVSKNGKCGYLDPEGKQTKEISDVNQMTVCGDKYLLLKNDNKYNVFNKK